MVGFKSEIIVNLFSPILGESAREPSSSCGRSCVNGEEIRSPPRKNRKNRKVRRVRKVLTMDAK